MGLSYACGLALAAKKRGNDTKVYVLLGDGELNEGSNWEAVMFAKQQNLGNLIAVVDNNGMQSDGVTTDILDVDLESVFCSFGWRTLKCDGHSTGELSAALGPSDTDAPKVILAKTVKGKGVSFMEDNNTWHHNRLNSEHYKNALREVDNLDV
jgi:transketolase